MGKQGGILSAWSLNKLLEDLQTKRPYIHKVLIQWISKNHPRYLWRDYGKTPYEVFIGEVSLTLAQPSTAVQIYSHIMGNYPHPQDLIKTPETDLKNALTDIQTRKYEKYLRSIAKRVLMASKGEMPPASELVFCNLGLEHSSARAIMCFGYGLPVAVINDNVLRLISRIFARLLPLEPDRGLLYSLGETLFSESSPLQYNRGILELAESICRSDMPLCALCPLGCVCDEGNVGSWVKYYPDIDKFVLNKEDEHLSSI